MNPFRIPRHLSIIKLLNYVSVGDKVEERYPQPWVSHARYYSGVRSRVQRICPQPSEWYSIKLNIWLLRAMHTMWYLSKFWLFSEYCIKEPWPWISVTSEGYNISSINSTTNPCKGRTFGCDSFDQWPSSSAISLKRLAPEWEVWKRWYVGTLPSKPLDHFFWNQ